MNKVSPACWIYSCIVLLVLIGLSLQPYFSLDEPNMLWSLRQGKGWTDYYSMFVGEGRPFFAMIELKELELAGTFENFKYFRIFSIVLTFLFCWLLFYFLRKMAVAKNTALLIAILVFSLPGFTVFIGWTQNPQYFSGLLSFYAGMLISAVFAVHLGEPALSRSKENIYISTAVLLQIVSLFGYQGCALAFVIPPFIMLVLRPEASFKKRCRFFFMTTLLFVICLVVYYKLFQSSLMSHNIVAHNRAKIGDIDIFGKLNWFTSVLKDASKLHLLLIKNATLSSILSFWIAFIIIRDLVKKRGLDVLFLLLCSLMLFFPHLIIEDSWMASRNFLLISVILVFYSVHRTFEMIPPFSDAVTAGIGTIFISIMCLNLWEGWVKPMKQNYALMRDFAKNLPAIEKDTLVIKFNLQPLDMHEKKSFLKQYSDEFNAPVFFRDWPVESGLKCLYQDTHPGVTVDKINTFIKVSERSKSDSTMYVTDQHHFLLKLEEQ